MLLGPRAFTAVDVPTSPAGGGGGGCTPSRLRSPPMIFWGGPEMRIGGARSPGFPVYMNLLVNGLTGPVATAWRWFKRTAAVSLLCYRQWSRSCGVCCGALADARVPPPPPPRDASGGKGPQRRPQRRLGRRLEEVAKAVGGGYCRLQMPLKRARRHLWVPCLSQNGTYGLVGH